MGIAHAASDPSVAVGAPQALFIKRPPQSLWADAARRLLSNRPAAASLVLIVVLVLIAALAPWLAPYAYDAQHLDRTWQGATAQHWLGTDAFGRDIFSRLIYGARISLTVAIMAQVIILALGVPLGLISGYAGGRIDSAIMRTVDALYAIPDVLIVIIFLAVIKQTLAQSELGVLAPVAWIDRSTGGLTGVFVGIGLTYWLTVCRLVRAQVLSLKERDFVVAARALGAGPGRILWTHLAPNCLAPVIVSASLGVPSAIMLEAGLSFIGLGISPPLPSWGIMVAEGLTALRSYPHAIIAPCAAISLTLIAFNFLGDGLRDALDPLMRG